MIHAKNGKRVRVMLTAFRDGLQSVFGGKVRTADIIPALQASVAAGIRHFEFGGGARYQAPYFYAGEDPFAAMDEMRAAVGEGVDLQILTRSVSGVTLTSQGLPALRLQAKLMAKHGTTVDRNFDFMNDVDNLIATAEPIVAAGMQHQLCVALMGLPYRSERVHTPEFYIQVVERVLASGVRVDSVCMKDASGTTDPTTIYRTAQGLKRILPPEVPLFLHTHDTASMAVACYMAGLEGGVDGIDLSVRPLASGTSQPDVRSMWHALKGTGFELDLDVSKMGEIEAILTEGLSEYEFNPITLAADARVVNFPMPGGAIGPNVHMMASAGILDRYGEVLAEFPEVVRAGGAWTSVTPGSQQYWLQAFNNVLHGRWKKIDAGYGRSVLGYFGRPPESPDPQVVEVASEQLGLPPFAGNPLAAASDSLAPAEAALRARGLPVSDENIFLVASAIVAGKEMDLNEGIRFLSGRARVNLPLKAKATPAPVATPTPAGPWGSPVVSQVTVEEGGRQRHFRVTIDPPGESRGALAKDAPVTNGAPAADPAANGTRTPVYSPFSGTVEVVAIKVSVGESVTAGQVVAAVEAMKAQHDVHSPTAGRVRSVDVRLGDEVGAGQSILTIEG
jgi:pyruvate carboxylase subunit B